MYVRSLKRLRKECLEMREPRIKNKYPTPAFPFLIAISFRVVL